MCVWFLNKAQLSLASTCMLSALPLGQKQQTFSVLQMAADKGELLRERATLQSRLVAEKQHAAVLQVSLQGNLCFFHAQYLMSQNRLELSMLHFNCAVLRLVIVNFLHSI